MKKNIFLLLAWFCAFFGEAQIFDWAEKPGFWVGTSSCHLATDKIGNIYMTGSFAGTIDIDPGSGVYNMTAQGNSDACVAKFNSNGALIWAKQLSGNNETDGSCIAVGDSCVYVSGRFNGTCDLDPGAGLTNFTSSGTYDTYFVKLDTSGNFIWASKQGDIGEDVIQYITMDDSCNLFATGYFTATCDFDPSPTASFYLTATGTNTVFLFKLYANGNFAWATAFSGPGMEIGRSVDVDDSGNVFTAGVFENTVDFDPGPATINLVSGGSLDPFFTKHDRNGNMKFAKQISSQYVSWGEAIAVDNVGNFYLAGNYAGTVDFDPGPGVYNLSGLATYTTFIAKFDSAANFIWARSFGGTNNVSPRAITIDNISSVYATGWFTGISDFDPGPGVYNLTESGNSWDSFIFKVDSFGNFGWAMKIGSSGDDKGVSVKADLFGNIYACGYFSGAIDFDPGPNSYTMISPSGTSTYLLKLGSSGIGIGENSPSDKTFEVFPNPAKDFFRIENISAGSVISLYDVSGRLILAQKANSEIHNVNTSNLQNGIFLVEINDENSRSFQRIVISR